MDDTSNTVIIGVVPPRVEQHFCLKSHPPGGDGSIGGARNVFASGYSLRGTNIGGDNYNNTKKFGGPPNTQVIAYRGGTFFFAPKILSPRGSHAVIISGAKPKN